jgi:RHH-type rel operon transcriptional repressor/antitoxin RelB
MPTSIRLSKDLEERLNELSRLTGRSKTYYITESIKQHLDKIEDLYLAEQRLINLRSGRSKAYTLKEVEEELDLED